MRAVAEEVRFELTDPCESPVFKTGAIDRSATPPVAVIVPVFPLPVNRKLEVSVFSTVGFGDEKDVDHLQDARRINEEKKNEPEFFLLACRYPHCPPFPHHRPNSKSDD